MSLLDVPGSKSTTKEHAQEGCVEETEGGGGLVCDDGWVPVGLWEEREREIPEWAN